MKQAGEDEQTLIGKVAIVTGASRGIGKAIALGFARHGARVVVAARSETAPSEGLPGSIHETVRAIEAVGGTGLAVRCDVTDEADVSAMVEQVLARFGRVDVLVNNAAIDFPRPVTEMPLKRWELVLKVNLTGPFLCSRAVLPSMIAQGAGSIINISSQAADEQGPRTVGYSTAYAVTKAGLDRFTWALADEVAQHGIAVNAVKPATVIDTEGMRLFTPEEERAGWSSPEKMVRSAVFLARQTAGSITATVLTDQDYCARYKL